MQSITLISTVHKDCGMCNPNELLNIIEHIAPDVIFEELSPNGFSAIYNGSQSDTLETIAIKNYIQNYSIKHVPVDQDNNEYLNLEFKREIYELFGVFSNVENYNKFLYQHEVFSYNYGFPYLNSNKCDELLEHLGFMKKDILRFINNERFSHLYQDWLGIHDKRENTMINNIYEYSIHNQFNRALFLIGAEHRKAILEKIPEFEKNNQQKLNWNSSYFD